MSSYLHITAQEPMDVAHREQGRGRPHFTPCSTTNRVMHHLWAHAYIVSDRILISKRR